MNNYPSGTRTLVAMMGAYPVAMVRRVVLRASLHVSVQAPPFTPKHLKTIINYLRSVRSRAKVITAVLLLRYSTMLWQGNLLATGPLIQTRHTIWTRKIMEDGQAITLLVRSIKTSRLAFDGQSDIIPGETICCLVKAWQEYQQATHLPISYRDPTSCKDRHRGTEDCAGCDGPSRRTPLHPRQPLPPSPPKWR